MISRVMPGLVPGIHVLCHGEFKTWMVGTSRAMTAKDTLLNQV